MGAGDALTPCPKCSAATHPECVKRCKAVIANGITSADKIVALLSHLNADESEVLLRITARLVLGRQQYGGLNIDTDRRDWAEQAAEEAFDGSVYHAILAVKLSRRGT